MDNILFYNAFYFTTCIYNHVHHTDRISGVLSHHVGRMLRGTARIVTDTGEELHLKSGDVFYMPLGLCYHSYWYPEEGEGGTVEFESYRFDLFPCRSGRQYALQILHPDAEALRYLALLSENKTVCCSSIGLLYAFLGNMFPNMQVAQGDRDRRLFSKAKHYISLHPQFHVSELARELAMSESALYAFFRSYAGTTPIELKNKMLADRAEGLLISTDFSLEKIGELLGFRSVAHLRNVIKQYTGKTPTALRNEKRSAHRI